MGYGAIGLGAVGLVMGVVYGLKHGSTQSDAKGHCTDYPSGCDATGISLNSDASTQGKIATGGLIAGGILVAGGIAITLTAPAGDNRPAQPAAMRIGPMMGRESGGVLLQGAW